MFRSSSPSGDRTSSGSIQPDSFSTMDEASSQASHLSRPSAKSIYMQRKEYAALVNQTMDKSQYRLEHLFTCKLDGMDLRSVADCVERLNLLEETGRVWGQRMLLEVRGARLLLTDMETKMELESFALSDIQEIKTVLDSGVFSSLLTVSVQPRTKDTTVIIFQCEDVRADLIQKDLLRIMSSRKQDPSFHCTEHISKYQVMKNRNTQKSYGVRGSIVDPGPPWMTPNFDEDDMSSPEVFVPEEEESQQPLPNEEQSPPLPYTELKRNVDILNHIFNDVESFMGQIAAATAKNAKRNKKKKNKGLPPSADFAECLQKIKCGFNLTAELNGRINNPSAPEFVHFLFMALAFVVSRCPEGLPQTIVTPPLTPQCIRLMSEEATAEEGRLWQSLGDAWNIPSTKGSNDDKDIPRYTLEFLNGWQPPEVSAAPEPRDPARRPESPRPTASQVTLDAKYSPGQAEKWRPAHPSYNARSGEPKQQLMRVLYDFTSRNNQELSIRRGEVVELLDKSKQWWKVRNHDGEAGFVPSNVLEPYDERPLQFSQQSEGSAALTKRSKPAEVKAWLEDKGFSKITVRCLGTLSGSTLLEMPREELKTLCPEEGGRVFSQLQAVQSTMAAVKRDR